MSTCRTVSWASGRAPTPASRAIVWALAAVLVLCHLLAPGHGYEAWLLLGGLAIAPVAPALTAQPPDPQRLLLSTPFAAVIATHGLIHLINAWRRWRRDAGSRQPALR